MKPHPLAHLIPDSNEFSFRVYRDMPMTKTGELEAVYSSEAFDGAFLSDAGGWQQRIADYDRAQFLDETEGPKYFSEIYDSLESDGDDGCHVYSQLAFDEWEKDGKGSETPYNIFQDSGICVDSSRVEMLWGLLAYLVHHSRGAFRLIYGPAHYPYSERGYCTAGWTLSGCATVNGRVGICPVTPSSWTRTLTSATERATTT
jgi:hypothetical protein